MSLLGALDKTKHFSEFGDPLDVGGSFVSAATRKATCLTNLGLTATAAELAVLAGVVAGTVSASKAVVVDANKHVDVLGLPVSGLKIGTSGSEVVVTASGTELNVLTGATNANAGTGKAVILGTSGALLLAGALTVTGGVAAAGGYAVSPRLMNTGANAPAVSTDFSDYTVVVTETIRAEVFVPANTSSTGVAIFNGSSVAGNLTAYLLDSTGAQVATTASTAQSGTDAYQRIAWTGGPIALKGPATYWVAVQGNNTGGKINTHTIGNFGADKQTGTVYGTLTVASSPTTFTTALGPVAGLY